MLIQLRNVQGKIFQLEVEPNSTIGDVKQKLEDEYKLPKANLKLILLANLLRDDQVISSLKIPKGVYFIIHVTVPRRPQPKPKPPTEQVPPPPVAPPPVPDQPAEHPLPPTLPPPTIPSQSGSSGQPSRANDPPNFEELVLNLTEVGFERPLCEQALRMANYDPERAANILLTGDIAQPPPQAAQNPGPSPTGVNFGQFQPVYDSFSPEEKAAVGRLLQYADPDTVIQLFMACDKNEEQTLGLLT